MKSLETSSGCSSAIDFGACMLSHFSHVQLFATLWTEAHQAPLTMEFSRQEYWSGFPFPPPRDLPDLGIKPASPALQADSLPLSHLGSPTVPMPAYSVARSCLILCNCSPPGSSDHGILQARILEWVPISSSRGSS